ncbi:hypothetical protein AAFZ03_28935, partial [Klebsiella pneumoniae]
MRNVRVYEEAWPLHTPFVIARGSRSEAKVVVVELEEAVKMANGEKVEKIIDVPYQLITKENMAEF